MRRLPQPQSERLLRLDKTSSVCILRAMVPSKETLLYRFWIARTRKHSQLFRPGGISCSVCAVWGRGALLVRLLLVRFTRLC